MTPKLNQENASLRHRIETLIRNQKAGHIDYGDEPALVIEELEDILLEMDALSILKGVNA